MHNKYTNLNELPTCVIIIFLISSIYLILYYLFKLLLQIISHGQIKILTRHVELLLIYKI